jgi:hypothetical protein
MRDEQKLEKLDIDKVQHGDITSLTRKVLLLLSRDHSKHCRLYSLHLRTA